MNYNTEFDDLYFSLDDGLAESTLVFIQGNQVVGRLGARGTLLIAELGFGSGLNLLALLQAIRLAGLSGWRVDWLSVDKTWIPPQQRQALLGHFPDLEIEVAQFFSALDQATLSEGIHRATITAWGGEISLTVLEADVLQLDAHLAALSCPIDAWILDGHSPAKNPQMWSPAVWAMIARHSIAGQTTVATYTAAGIVKQGLRQHGFRVERKKGYGKKHHRLEALFLPPDSPPFGP